MDRFMEVFGLTSHTWERSLRQARRTGMMVIVYPNCDEDRATRQRWDPEKYVRVNSTSCMAWRRDFVEKVLLLDCVPDLESMPDAIPSTNKLQD